MSDHVIQELFPFAKLADAEEVMPLYNDVTTELSPDSAPSTVAEYRARYDRPNMDFRHFVTRDASGQVDGLLIPMHFIDGSNDHFQWSQLLVRRDRRRLGLGKALLKRAHDVAIEDGRTMITIDAFESSPPGSAFATAVGATVALTEHINVVEVADLDTAMLERWREEGPARAEDYEMLVFEDTYPAEHLGSIAALWIMADEDMPLEDLDLNPQSETAESVAALVAARQGLVESITAMPRHKKSGDLVGFSELFFRKSDRDTLQTTLTMVHRDHRGHALGKWVKAEAILRGLERWPSGVRIKTENAKSNAPMLAINDAIGFKSKDTVLGYHAPVETIAAYLQQT